MEENANPSTANNSGKKDNVWKWATFVLVIVLVAVVFYMVGSKNAGSTGNVVNNPSQPSQQQGTTQPVQVSADDDPYLGPKDAKTTVIEFSDFQCPFCGAAAGTNADLISRFKAQDPSWQAAEPELEKLAKAGKIKLVFRDFPLTSIHPFAQKSAEAGECAHEQGKFWEYHDLIFQHQDALTVDDLKKYAQEVGLDTDKFNSCLDGSTKASEIKKDTQDGVSAGVQGTPTFFVGDGKTWKTIEGAQSFSAFKPYLGV